MYKRSSKSEKNQIKIHGKWTNKCQGYLEKNKNANYIVGDSKIIIEEELKMENKDGEGGNMETGVSSPLIIIKKIKKNCNRKSKEKIQRNDEKQQIK